jgi:hypothetical protein
LIEGSDYRFWQRLHGRPLLNGARPGTPADDLRRGLVDPGTPGTAQALALLGVTAIVTRADALDYTDGVPDVPNASWGPGYELVERFADGSSVWQVVAAPAPAVATLRGAAFAGPNKPRGRFIGYPLEVRRGEIELRAKSAGIVQLSFRLVVPNAERKTVRIAGVGEGKAFRAAAQTTLVSLVVSVPRGVSRLHVTADPAKAGESPIELSAPRVSRTSLAPVLRAEPLSSDPGF